MQKKLLYYVDGYHGGVRGHMPLGCWRDIVETLKNNPEWKLCLDIEPISWDELQNRDPATYAEIREMLRDTSDDARLEIVSGSYGQPYAWITDGESNIRQLTMGLDVIKKHFPWITVTTYATQEPCWTSAMPQMLRSLHFERAVLKNPSTAWGGYSQGYDAEVCLWEGPDGTQIPLVPRYACEQLVKTWETESVDGTEEFTAKCIEHGIEHPAGMIFQDLGWPSWPRLGGTPDVGEATIPAHVIHTTWKEYFTAYAKKPWQAWRITQETFTGALPWGERLLVRMARQVRRGEKAMLQCERLHAMGVVLSGRKNFQERLNEAWAHLLMTQHHDGWICTANGNEEENWAWKASAQIYAMESLIAPVKQDALAKVSSFACARQGHKADQEHICVVNTLGRAEVRTVSVPVTSGHGTEEFRVWDGENLLPSQYMAERTFTDGSKNAGILHFRAMLPAFGVKAFRIEPVALPSDARMVRISEDCVRIETDIYSVCIDLGNGGTVSSLVDKQQGFDLVDPKHAKKFNEYSGFFIEENRFCSSAEQRAEAVVRADGPVYAEVEIHGKVGPVAFTQQLRVINGERAIKVQTTFHFPEKTYIGDPYEITPPNNTLDPHRSYHDGRYKLNAWFPTAFAQTCVDKDAAYDVCRSQLPDTVFTTWNEIKHNVALGWVDVTDSRHGLAVATDHTTSYIHGKDIPLGLTMAWGGTGGYWWGKRQLKGDHTVSYSILPHEGDWQQGCVWHECQKIIHEPAVQRAVGCDAIRSCEIIAVQEPAELSAAYMAQDGTLRIRLFNPGPRARIEVSLASEWIASAQLVELDGTHVEDVPLASHNHRLAGTLDLPAFAIRTLSLALKN